MRWAAAASSAVGRGGPNGSGAVSVLIGFLRGWGPAAAVGSGGRRVGSGGRRGAQCGDQPGMSALTNHGQLAEGLAGGAQTRAALIVAGGQPVVDGCGVVPGDLVGREAQQPRGARCG